MSDIAPSSAPPKATDKNWSRRLVIAGVVLFGLLILAWVGAAFVPRWWAHRVGDQANESFSGGISLGLFYGFVFTLLPLLLIVWGIRKRRSAKAWLFILAGALLLALPNLFTLGITVGRGNAAHAGDRTLDVDAPGFRGRDARRRAASRSRSWASSGTCSSRATAPARSCGDTRRRSRLR